MARWLNNIEGVLRRYPWVIPLGALVPCAYFAARGANDLVAARLFAADTDSLARSLPGAAAIAAASEPTANHHVRDRAAIIHRNIFDSDAGCLDCDAGPPGDAEVDGGGPPQPEEAALPPEACYPVPPADGRVRPGPCETTAKILGAVESDDLLWSFVLVQSAPNGPAMPYRFGSTLENRSVGIVSWCQALGAYVLLRPPGGQRCFLAQNMPAHAAPAAPAAPVAAATPAAAGGSLGGVLEGIERVSANEYNVRRSTVDRILESQAELMRTTRIMPVDQGGRVIGVQLFGVRGNSLLGRLGMQNGDVLNRINGLDIGSPDRALEAYSRLRTSDNLQVSVTRNGQPVNIDFHIR
jgi:general secretion pathway protein C